MSHKIKQSPKNTDNFKPRADTEEFDLGMFEDPEDMSMIQTIPQAIFIMLLIVAIIYAIYDLESLIKQFEHFVDYVRNNFLFHRLEIIL